MIGAMAMAAMREKDQSDFDLDRFIDMFDEALTSKDERVTDALRSLMMMVILTKGETKNPIQDRQRGPLRRLVDDVSQINRLVSEIEGRLRQEIQAKEYELERIKKWDYQSAAGSQPENYKFAINQIAALKPAPIPTLSAEDIRKWSPPNLE